MTEPDFSGLPFGPADVVAVWVPHEWEPNSPHEVRVRRLDDNTRRPGETFIVASGLSSQEATACYTRTKVAVNAARRLAGKDRI